MNYLKPTRVLAIVLVALLAATGCAGQGPYRSGTGAVERFVADPSRCPELKEPSPHRIGVAYIEIDEQGYFQDRGQVEQALALVAEGPKPKYVVVFVHGWFHSARGDPDDTNIQRFKCSLNSLQGIDGNTGESVIGVYVGWRGDSISLPGMRFTTFWDRKNTSEEIGRGSLVEFLTRLERTVKPVPTSPNKLMLVGHSFGASVVFNSISQILLARFLLDAEGLLRDAQSPTHSQSKHGLVSGYGDLVVLVNPAIEATRIMPLFSSLNEYTTRRPDLLSPAQPVRLLILSSEGDQATRLAFPVARFFSTILESYEDRRLRTPYGIDLDLKERYLDWQTMGNVAPILTHAPLREATASPWSGKCPPVDREWQSKVIEERKTQQRARGEPETGAGWSKVFDGAAITLTHRGITTPSNPLWLMAVGTKLIPDHSGFADPVMICFLDELLGDPAVVNPEGERHLEKLRRER